jgi:hypothetical protein
MSQATTNILIHWTSVNIGCPLVEMENFLSAEIPGISFLPAFWL